MTNRPVDLSGIEANKHWRKTTQPKPAKEARIEVTTAEKPVVIHQGPVNIRVDSITNCPTLEIDEKFKRIFMAQIKDGTAKPISVHQTSPGSFALIDGARRLVTARDLGLVEIPAIVEGGMFNGIGEG